MAIASVVGAGISAAGSLLGTHQRNEAQKRESELAYQRERAAIKEQNAYNSSSAQMARLQAAGLNPNMMYETSQEAAAGTQTDVAHYQPAELDNAFEPMGNAGQQMIQNLVGLKDMENKTALANSQILLNASTKDFQVSQSKKVDAECKRLLELLKWDVSNAEADFKLKTQELSNSVKEGQKLAEDIKLLSQKFQIGEEELKQMDAQTRFILARLPYANEFAALEVGQKRAEIQKIAAEIAYMQAQEEIGRGQLKVAEFNKWVGLGDVIARNVINAAGVTAKFLGKGASLNELFGADPWSMMQGKGAFTKGFDLNDSANPFGQFLSGD